MNSFTEEERAAVYKAPFRVHSNTRYKVQLFASNQLS